MAMIRMMNNRRRPSGAPASQGLFDRRKRVLATRRAAQIGAAEMEKYDAAVDIYRSGGCRLREIEHGAISRFKHPEPIVEAAPAQLLQLGAVDAASMTRGVFRGNGEFWTVGLEGSETFVRDRKGLHYIADLLRRPGVEVHALDLVTAGCGVLESAPSGACGLAGSTTRCRPIRDYLDRGNAGPMLDRQAKSEYLHRLAELREQLEAAEAQGDEQRARRVEEETQALQQELKRALDFFGRPRFAADITERARVNVTRNISLVIERIAQASPDLGRHLDASIKTGLFSCYRPDSSMQPIRWTL
jgi:hypothetical protein